VGLRTLSVNSHTFSSAGQAHTHVCSSALGAQESSTSSCAWTRATALTHGVSYRLPTKARFLAGHSPTLRPSSTIAHERVNEALCSETCIDFKNESSVAHITFAQSAKRPRCKTQKVYPSPSAISLNGCSLYYPWFKARRNRRQQIFVRACVHVQVFVHACEFANGCVELDVGVSICMYVYTHMHTATPAHSPPSV